jgi:hypothetical protein
MLRSLMEDGAMDPKAHVEHMTIHLDWTEDPPRCQRQPRVPAQEPGSIELADAEVELRVRGALEPYHAAGWDTDGELWEAVSVEARQRQVLLPTPGRAGPIWEEYTGAAVHLRRAVGPSRLDPLVRLSMRR